MNCSLRITSPSKSAISWRSVNAPAESARMKLRHFSPICSSTVPPRSKAAPLTPRAIDICLQTKQSVYDCLYVALAERETCEFVTADKKLIRNLQGTFPFILDLATLP